MAALDTYSTAADDETDTQLVTDLREDLRWWAEEIGVDGGDTENGQLYIWDGSAWRQKPPAEPRSDEARFG